MADKKALKINREPQTWPFLKGDLTPRKTDFTDLRNDFAGTANDQCKSIILRYLETLPAGDHTDLQTMSEDISRHYPFHGKKPEYFAPIVQELRAENLVLQDGDNLRINKVARVASKYLKSKLGQ
jgi:hypothetical protein